MDLKQLEYIVAIEQYGNVTEAASRLFVTPSALNQQLLKLEKELNLLLFTRGRRQMIPTKAGRIYLDTAKQMLNMRQITYAQLQDLSGHLVGTYQIGLSFEHGSDMFARIYPSFNKIYPGVQMRCVQLLVPDMLERLESRQLDIAFILTGDCTKLQSVEYIPLSEENLLLGLPVNHPVVKSLYGDNPPPYPACTFDLNLVRSDDFAFALSRSTMRRDLIDPIFQKAGIAPNIIIESSFNNFLEQLASQGICNAIIPQSRIRNFKDIAWFYLPGHPRFQFGAAYQKNYRLNQAQQAFIQLAKEDAMRHMNFPPPEC